MSPWVGSSSKARCPIPSTSAQALPHCPWMTSEPAFLSTGAWAHSSPTLAAQTTAQLHPPGHPGEAWAPLGLLHPRTRTMRLPGAAPPARNVLPGSVHQPRPACPRHVQGCVFPVCRLCVGSLGTILCGRGLSERPSQGEKDRPPSLLCLRWCFQLMIKETVSNRAPEGTANKARPGSAAQTGSAPREDARLGGLMEAVPGARRARLQGRGLG